LIASGDIVSLAIVGAVVEDGRVYVRAIA